MNLMKRREKARGTTDRRRAGAVRRRARIRHRLVTCSREPLKSVGVPLEGNSAVSDPWGGTTVAFVIGLRPERFRKVAPRL